MFASIGDALPRFRIYEELFRNHERLLRAISAAYLDILRFCIRGKNFFSNARRAPLPLSIVCKGIWKPFRQDFDSYMTDFRKHHKRVEKEASLAHMIEAAQRREVEKANQALQKHNDKISKRHNLLSTLQTVDYQSKHRAIADLRQPGTNTWLQSDSRYVAWLGSPKSDCLCCYGIPGAGKSVLASSVVEILYQCMNDPGTILCYYYFDYADTRSLDVNFLLGSLMKQVVIQLPLDYFDESLELPIDGHAFKPLADKISTFLQLLKNFSKAFIVLDGLDELSNDGQTATLRLLVPLLQMSQPIVKVFVTSRVEEPIIRKGLHAHTSLELSPTNVSVDISLFVERELQLAAESNPILKDTRLRKEVNNALTKGANGMFLWVKFQMHDICEALTKKDIRSAIQNLPKDLRETYARIMARIYSSPGGSVKVQTMRKVLQWVSCARRPLLLEELEEAIGLEKQDTYLHTDRIPTNSGEKIIASCGNLIVYDREDNTVTFAHPTVRQFCCSQPPGEIKSYPESMHLDIGAADTEIGEICVAYLSFSDFETQLVKVPSPTTLERGQAERIIWNRVPMASQIQGFMSWKSSLRNQRSNDPAHQMEYQFPLHMVSKPPELKAKYALLPYIVEYWALHTSRFTETAPCWPAFVHLTLYRNLHFEFRPWTAETLLDIIDPNALREYPWAGMYIWAMDTGIGSFLILLAVVPALDNSSQFEDYLIRRCCHKYGADYDPDQVVRQYILLLSTSYPSSADPRGTHGPQYNPCLSVLVYRVAALLKIILRRNIGMALLKFLLDELEDTLIGDCKGRVDRICDEAMAMAITVDLDAFSSIAAYRIRSFEHLSRTIVSVVKAKISQEYEAIERLLCSYIVDEKPVCVDRDLVNALSPWLVSIMISINEGRLEPGRMSQQCIWILSLLCLAQTSYSAFVVNVDFFGGMGKLLLHLDNAYLNWEFFPGPIVTSDDITSRLIPEAIQGQSPLSVAFQRLQCTTDGTFKFVFECLYAEIRRGIPVEHLEETGIHCLQWAAEQDMPQLVSILMPQYAQFIRADSSQPYRNRIRQDILLAAMRHSEQSLDRMLVYHWPEHITKTVILDPVFKQLQRTNQWRLKSLRPKPYRSIPFQRHSSSKPSPPTGGATP